MFRNIVMPQAPALALLLLLTVFTGCTPHISVMVESLAEQKVEQRTNYWLAPADSRLTPDDLRFKQVATSVEKALWRRGYEKVPQLSAANVLILLDYGVSDPHVAYSTSSYPIYGYKPEQTANLQGTAVNSDGVTVMRGTTTAPASYGVIGTGTSTQSETTYTRRLSLLAYDLAVKPPKQIWRTDVISVGSNSDLGIVLPYMLTAAYPYLATNSQGQKQIVLKIDDPLVAQFEKTPISRR